MSPNGTCATPRVLGQMLVRGETFPLITEAGKVGVGHPDQLQHRLVPQKLHAARSRHVSYQRAASAGAVVMSVDLEPMPPCVVIQPFDDGPFDTRTDDVFVPAIRAATLDADREDRDSSAVIPLEEVETMIRAADAGLADISASNPNVWFELGFAMAAGKSVVLGCLQDPNRRFPFDIQHREIITDRTESSRDCED